MTNEELVKVILKEVGGRNNVLAVTNCMTRLRIDVKKDSLINEDALKKIEGVMGIVHDKEGYVEVVVGPGKCRKCSDICASMGIPASAAAAGASGPSTDNDWQANKAAVKAGQKQGKVKTMLKTLGEIFVPLIPGVIASGICSGVAVLLAQLVPNYAEIPLWNIIYNLLTLINQGFLTYITAWAGYRAAEKFGATPILGGMLGMITTLGGIDNISKAVGLYNEENALNEPVQEYTNDSPIKDTKSNPIFDLISISLILFVVGLSIYSLKYKIDQRPKAVDYDIDSNSTAIPFNSVVE